MRGAGDAGRPMDIEPEVLVSDQRGFAGMQTNAHSNRRILGPRMFREHRLNSSCAGASLQGTPKHNEEGVALRPQLQAAVRAERLSLDGMVREQDVRITIAEFLNQLCRSLDIAEKERDRASRQAHAIDAERLIIGSRIVPSCR